MVFQETQHEVYSSFKCVCGVSSSVRGSKLEGAALLQMGNKALRDNRQFPSKLMFVSKMKLYFSEKCEFCVKFCS